MKNQKLLIIVIAIIVVGLGGYLYFSRSSDTTGTSSGIPGSSTLISTNTGENPVPIAGDAATTPAADNADIAGLLRNISSIRMDTGVLNNPAFLALTDTTLTLPQVEVNGRVNPFGFAGSPAPSPVPAADTATLSTPQ